MPSKNKPKQKTGSRKKKGITQIPMTITSRMLKNTGLKAQKGAKFTFNRDVENVDACLAMHASVFAKARKAKTIAEKDVVAAFASDSVKDCFSKKWTL